jgi:hypothetical protein
VNRHRFLWVLFLGSGHGFNRGVQRFVAGLQAADRRIQTRLRGLYLGCRIHSLGSLGCGFGGPRVGTGSRFACRFDFAVALRQFFLQHLQLFLLCLQCLTQLFHLCGNFSVALACRRRPGRLGRCSIFG